MIDTFRSLAEAKLDLLRQSVAIDPNSARRWYDLAYALADAGDYDGYAAAFERAFRIRPAEMRPRPDRLGDPAEARKLRERALALIDRGFNNGAALAALAVSEWALGSTPALARLTDYARLLRCLPSVVPAGYDAAAFLEALAREIKKDLRFYGTSDNFVMRNAWRNENTLASDAPVCRALAAEIRRHVGDYIADIAVGDRHPLITKRPADFAIKGWAIVTRNDGHLVSHIHPRAWLNGVYYVASPGRGESADPDAGRLRIGPPADVAIEGSAQWPELLVDPKPGTLLLMPAYFFHKTQPTESDQERICVAFDVEPRDERSTADGVEG